MTHFPKTRNFLLHWHINLFLALKSSSVLVESAACSRVDLKYTSNDVLIMTYHIAITLHLSPSGISNIPLWVFITHTHTHTHTHSHTHSHTHIDARTHTVHQNFSKTRNLRNVENKHVFIVSRLSCLSVDCSNPLFDTLIHTHISSLHCSPVSVVYKCYFPSK